jgi:ribosome-associated heat shock protein Hsp15
MVVASFVQIRVHSWFLPVIRKVESVRIDKWLWGTRVYKTRADAADACRGSAIRHKGVIAKPSATVRIGDIVIARTKALTRTLHVVGLTEKVGRPTKKDRRNIERLLSPEDEA